MSNAGGTLNERERLVYSAKLAEQAERYDGEQTRARGFVRLTTRFKRVSVISGGGEGAGAGGGERHARRRVRTSAIGSGGGDGTSGVAVSPNPRDRAPRSNATLPSSIPSAAFCITF